MGKMEKEQKDKKIGSASEADLEDMLTQFTLKD
jgi:hypothetical protein